MLKKVAAIILGAGKGTRMNSDLPKVMMKVAEKPMVRHIIDVLSQMEVSPIVTVISKEGELVKKEVFPNPTVVQENQLGTGDAVKAARSVLEGFDGAVLVVFGDTPLIKKETFERIVQKIEEGFEVVVLGFETENPARYGRLKMDGNKLVSIIEYKDATEEERKISFCNSGCMGFDGRYLFKILDKISNENAAKEYYLTDAVQIAQEMGLRCTAIAGDLKEVSSANTREELMELEKYYKERNLD